MTASVFLGTPGINYRVHEVEAMLAGLGDMNKKKTQAEKKKGKEEKELETRG